MRLFLSACFLSLALVEQADATATMAISWDGGPTSPPVYSRSHAEGPLATVVVTATGFDKPVRGVAIQIRVQSRYDGMPDAWRYDPGGCAAGAFHTPEVALDPDYPFLTGANAQRIKDALYNSGSEFFAYYQAHDAVPVSAGARYTIAQFQFDTSLAFAGLGVKPDSCGCIDQPQGIYVVWASWLDSEGNEHPFSIENECVGWNDPNNGLQCPYFAHCDLCPPNTPPPPHNPCADQQPTAAARRSWGSVKALYR